MNELSKTESVDLKHCESVIEKTKDSFFECGMAMRQIKEEKLYKGTYSTFEEYCKTRWGWERAHAYRLIEFAEIKMSPMGDKITNERQAREIAKVPQERRQEVMEKAFETGHVTAASIARAAKEEKVIELDKTGHPIPAAVMEDWSRAEEIKDVLKLISDARCTIKAGLHDEDIIYREVNNGLLANLNDAYTSLKCVVPHAVCPTCQGHQKKKCTLCKGRGFISEFLWTQCVPAEIKAMRQKAKK